MDHTDLPRLFEEGVHARHPDVAPTLDRLGAHMGAAGTPSPFISTTNELGHALARDGGFHDGVVLDIRDPGGHAIDADASFKVREQERFMSHGEGEKVYIGQIPPEHIHGAWAVVDGQHRWFPNPHFDHNILKGQP